MDVQWFYFVQGSVQILILVRVTTSHRGRNLTFVVFWCDKIFYKALSGMLYDCFVSEVMSLRIVYIAALRMNQVIGNCPGGLSHMSTRSFLHFSLIRENSVIFISLSHSYSLCGSSQERNLTSVSSAKTGSRESLRGNTILWEISSRTITMTSAQADLHVHLLWSSSTLRTHFLCTLLMSYRVVLTVNNIKMSHNSFPLALSFAFFCWLSDSHFVLFSFPLQSILTLGSHPVFFLSSLSASD